eukprot:TRINITY_DN2566_c0_g2_i1.p4 TRINITY_DN2566_c0_g2~~TRINITY_DN2566_c0_g2_i1.p4  ORF type:complete len:119 (-),score=13.20 TRINITY_DN2566_c0_g2_i1:7-363(-)
MAHAEEKERMWKLQARQWHRRYQTLNNTIIRTLRRSGKDPVAGPDTADDAGTDSSDLGDDEADAAAPPPAPVNPDSAAAANVSCTACKCKAVHATKLSRVCAQGLGCLVDHSVKPDPA